MSQQAQAGAKKFKAKEFRVAVEGGTTDGRTIQRNWITEMAETYNPQVYGARAWMEHLRSPYPDSTFGAHGDVLSVRAAEITEGDLKGRMALYATIQPLESMVVITTKAKQKIYTSIEIDPQFAKTGKAYLTGLGFTDSPASLGTSILEFAAKNPAANPFANKKLSADSLISEGIEQDMSFEPEAPADEGVQKFMNSMKGFIAKFTGKAQGDDARFNAVQEGFEAVTEQFGKQDAALASTDKNVAAVIDRVKQLETQYSELKGLMDNTDHKQFNKRPPATGGNGQQVTDC